MTDALGLQSTAATKTFTIEGLPTASFTAAEQQAPVGQAIAFDAGGWSDPNAGGSVSSWAWSFGDGATGTGPRTAHAYSAPGVYTVSLVVTDAAGLHSSAAMTAVRVVAPLEPSFTATPAHALTGSKVTFTALASSDPNSGVGLSSYTWSFGDGSGGAGPTTSHSYAEPGAYRVTLTVSDSLGLTATKTELVDVVAPGLIDAITVQGQSLLVSVSEPGRVTLSGQSVILRDAGAATLKIPLTRAQARQLARRRGVRVRLTIVYVPRYGLRVTRTLQLIVKPTA